MFKLVCPICDKVLEVEHRHGAPYRPFCSERCKMIDLGRWLDGTYRVSEPARPEQLEGRPLEDDSSDA